MSDVDYRFGFNGKEMDNEVSGNGNQYDYGFRIYNPRIGKFLSVDPLTKSYPYLTPYQFASNTPICGVDLDGLEFYYTADGILIGSIDGSTEIRVVTNQEIINNLKISIKRANENDGWVKDFYTGIANDASTSLIDYAEDVFDLVNKDAMLHRDFNDCKAAADAEMERANIKMNTTEKSRIQTDVNNNLQGEDAQLTENAYGGAIYIITQLKKGNIVEVGTKAINLDGTIDDEENTNRNTNHFVVIVGMSVKLDYIYFRYYDNASGYCARSTGNEFILVNDTGKLIDDSRPCLGNTQSLTVSEVRTNKEK